MKVNIRPMSMDDLEQVQVIDQYSFSLPWPKSAYRFELLENPNSLLWVAEIRNADDNNQVVGMAVIWLVVDEAHIATLAVHPDYRSLGIGKKLLISALRASVEKGMTIATLEVRISNLAAQALYQKFGFEIAGRRRGYYQDNHEDALIMNITGLGRKYLSQLDALELIETSSLLL